MYHVISVGLNSELLSQLDDLRCVYPDFSRKDIIANLIRDAHASAFGWDKPTANDNPAFECSLPVVR